MIGIPLFCLSIANLSIALGNMFRVAYCKFIEILKAGCSNNNAKSSSKKEKKNEINNNFGPSFITAPKNEVHEEDDSDEESIGDDAAELTPRVRIPLIFAILILAVYLLIGAFVFQKTESDWNNTHSAYFSFITMATIGIILRF